MAEKHAASTCYHCGTSCPEDHPVQDNKSFCCEGCLTVYQLLSDHELCQYYDLEAHPGIRLPEVSVAARFLYLDRPEVGRKLFQYEDEQMALLHLRLPQIHCASCVWLLENLYRLQPGILGSEVDFLRREIKLRYDKTQLSLSQVVSLLASLGYEPEINLEQGETAAPSRTDRKLVYRLGVAGFCFGNIMLFSFPHYLGLSDTGASYSYFFGWLNFLLSLPVFFYSSQLFFQHAWEGIKHKVWNLDMPISLGILALFSWSNWEFWSGMGAGYFDSLAGLVFLLLVGKWIQGRTFAALAFEKDYQAYFPLSATRLTEAGEESVLVTDLEVGDKVLIRHGEMVPGDAILLSEEASMDYRFITGESEAVQRQQGETLYAGGKQQAESIEILIQKPVSQSYLSQLWDDPAFRKRNPQQQWADQLGKRFTLAVILVALLSGAVWAWLEGWAMAVQVATAVLIVACPCGIALTAPVIFSHIMAGLGKLGCYLKSGIVLGRMAELTDLVFDKTGTLTQADASGQQVISPEPPMEDLIPLVNLARQSTHPKSRFLAEHFSTLPQATVENFSAESGQGISGWVDGQAVRIGRADFVGHSHPSATGSWARVGQQAPVALIWREEIRPGLAHSLEQLSACYTLSLLSGDQNTYADAYDRWFPKGRRTFEVQPQEKLQHIKALQADGKRVMMVGDGLNDAGALQASEVGMAITDAANHFSPACDIILEGKSLARLPVILDLAARAKKGVQLGWGLSLAYNLVGLGFAVSGLLSPLVAAILMPLSSVSVLVFGTWFSRRLLLKYLSEPHDKSHPEPVEKSSGLPQRMPTFELS